MRVNECWKRLCAENRVLHRFLDSVLTSRRLGGRITQISIVIIPSQTLGCRKVAFPLCDIFLRRTSYYPSVPFGL